jgi:arginyl-tRNA synthetase
MEERLKTYIKEALASLGAGDASFTLEHPGEFAHGDWATNAAMVAAKKVGKNPRALAEEIAKHIEEKNDANIQAIKVAGPGFINFKLTDDIFVRAVDEAVSKGSEWGKNTSGAGKKVIVEYTDPNPFKEFHIGHLMSNAIGESISRLIEASGAETKRACYQGDVGLHVAKAMWGAQHPDINNVAMKDNQHIRFWGWAYVNGSKAYEEDAQAKIEINALNKKIYDRTDVTINESYDLGKQVSLDYFEKIYQRLGTNFDFKFFESKTGVFGKEIVEKHPEIFEKSDGAIVYKGDESKGLHTRVFINKDGLPTYEAKELGLAQIKYDTYPYDTSIVITGNEVNDYFKVLLDAMGKVFPELAIKTEHYSHGMLRLPTGKMSSRTGDVLPASRLIDEAIAEAVSYFLIEKKIDQPSDEQRSIAEVVAIGAVKYSILRQAAGKDIIFDFEQSLSFDGDSGPYLQYTHARIFSLLSKAEHEGIKPSVSGPHTSVGNLEKILARFPEVVLRAERERAPHYVATYLIELAREFNSYYGANIIVDQSPEAPYKVALAAACRYTFSNGLWLLGIVAPTKM